MPEWEPRDLVELRIRGEFIDVVGLLSHVGVEIVDSEADRAGLGRAKEVVMDLTEQAQQQVNYGLAERQLKRMVQADEVPSYRGIDVRVHEFDPRHPDEESELDVENLPPFEEADTYAIVLKDEDGLHMAGYPDDLDVNDALELATGVRIFARDIEDTVTARMDDPRGGES